MFQTFARPLKVEAFCFTHALWHVTGLQVDPRDTPESSSRTLFLHSKVRPEWVFLVALVFVPPHTDCAMHICKASAATAKFGFQGVGVFLAGRWAGKAATSSICFGEEPLA